tara:strand:- start:6063 stop:6662 length:600 start_codon:yes stop_codon:yes gene_type:complete
VRNDAASTRATALRLRAPLTVCVRARADADSVQMLTRSSQIGEFYIMSPPQVAPTNGTLHTADMMIYDEESDKHVRITWREALDATLAGDAAIAGPNAMVSTGSGEIPLADWKGLAEQVRGFNEINNGDYQALKNSGATDIRIVVARPFIEHLMVRQNPSRPLVPACASDRRCPCCAAQRHPRGVGPRDGRHAVRLPPP